MPRKKEIYDFVEMRYGQLGMVKVRDLNNPVRGITQARKWAKILRKNIKVGNFVGITRYGEPIGSIKRYR